MRSRPNIGPRPIRLSRSRSWQSSTPLPRWRSPGSSTSREPLPKRWVEALAAEEPLRLAPAPKTDPGEVLTVGLLRQYTEQLPPDTRILLPGDGSATRLIFTQCFAADTGEKHSTLQLC